MSLWASGTPCSGPFGLAARERAVRGLGGRQRLVGLDAHEGVERRLPALDAREQAPRVTSTDESLRRRIAAATSVRVSSAGSLTGRSPAAAPPTKLAGSVSNGNRDFLGGEARDHRRRPRARCARADLGASGTRAAAAMVATRSA